VSKEENCILFSIQSNGIFDLILDIIDFKESLLEQQISFNEDQFTQKNTYQNQSSYYTNISWDTSKRYKKIADNKIMFSDLTEITFFFDITFKPLSNDNQRNTYNEIKVSHVFQHKKKYNKIVLDLVDSKERLRSIDEIFEEMGMTQSIPSILYEKMYDASR